MKKWSAKNKFLFMAFIALGVTFTLTMLYWSKQTSSIETASDANPSFCPTMTDKLSKSNSLKFHPIKIVAKPWRGEHNVYAIFALPLKYYDIYQRSQLLVKGTDTPWDVTPTDGLRDGQTAPEGHFLVIGFFRTRLALWYWASGRFGDLQQPCNWTLHLFPK